MMKPEEKEVYERALNHMTPCEPMSEAQLGPKSGPVPQPGRQSEAGLLSGRMPAAGQLASLTPYEIFGTYTHIGIVVRDMDAACGMLRRMFGYVPDSFGETPSDQTRRYFGCYEDFKCRMAFIYLENTMLEVLTPLQGKSVWQDFLDEQGEGIHHINFDVKQYDLALKHLQEQGLKVVQSGSSMRRPGCRWSYVDMKKELGIYLEISEVYA